MLANNLVYNKPFELENWDWEFKGIKYYANKYRQIDCDKEAYYYYDFIIIEFKDINENNLFTIRKYSDENTMSFLRNPYLTINKNLSEILQKLKEK